MLPLHPDRMRVDILAVRAELHLPARTHRGVATRDVEGCERLTHFLRLGRGRALKRISDHECLSDETTRILEQKLAVLLLVRRIHRLGIGINIMVPMRNAQQALRSIADVLVKVRNNKAARATVDGHLQAIMAGVGDPVASGFVKSLAKPGGNITGPSNLSIDLTAKSLELLHAAVPSAQRIAVLRSPNQAHETMLREAYAAAEGLGLKIIPVMARTPADLDVTFSIMRQQNCEALFVFADARITQKIVELADKWRLPAIYQITGFVDMGGLLSYGQNWTELFQHAAIYVDKILKGANPADLPVEQPTKFELEINLKTAKALGLTIPDSILARADKVIE